MMMKALLVGAAALAVSGPALSQSYAPYETATLRTLDKITGRSTDIEVETDNPIVFGSLTITMRACFRTPPEEPPESAAFLQIYTQQALADAEVAKASVEDLAGRDDDKIFSGWMFASSPGLSALEHPVYDVWVIKCNVPEPVSDFGENGAPAVSDDN